MKGQFSIITLIFTILMLVMYGALLPVINTFITNLLPNADAPTAALLQLVPVIILILIVLGMFIRGTPER